MKKRAIFWSLLRLSLHTTGTGRRRMMTSVIIFPIDAIRRCVLGSRSMHLAGIELSHVCAIGVQANSKENIIEIVHPAVKNPKMMYV